MKKLNDQELNTWKKKRAKTMIGYFLIAVVGGIDYSIVITTLYLYLTTLIKTSNPNLYYGMIIAVYSLSSTISGLITGRLVDRTRNIKSYIYIILSFQLIGNLLYAVHFSPLFPFLGRLLAGVGDTFAPVSCGEVIRIYDEEGGTTALWRISSAYSLGFILGSAIGLVFKGIDFQIGILTIQYTNFVGIFMAGLMIICFVTSYMLITDCSLEYDMKEYLSNQNKNIMVEPEKENKKKSIFHNDEEYVANDVKSFKDEKSLSTTYIVKKFLSDQNMVVMVMATIFFTYSMFTLDILLPLIILQLLQWDSDAVMIVLTSYGIVHFILLLACGNICNTNQATYNTLIFCIVCQMLCYVMIIAMSQFERNFNRDIILMIFFLIPFLFVLFINEILLRSIVAKMVPSHVQSFTETFRDSFSRLSTIVGGLTAAIALPVIQYWSFGLQSITFLFLVVFLMKRKVFTCISEINI